MTATTNTISNLENGRLIDSDEARRLAGNCSKSHLHAEIARGRFPRPIKLSSRFVRWRASDISAWLADPEIWIESHRVAA